MTDSRAALVSSFAGCGDDVCLLGPAEAALDFAPLTNLALRPLLAAVVQPERLSEVQASDGACVAWGVRCGVLAVGLLLARIEYGDSAGNGPAVPGLCVLSLAVRQPWRRQGYARNLLAAAVEWAAQQGMTSVVIDVPLETPSSHALHCLTSPQCGWVEEEGLLLAKVADPRLFHPLYWRMHVIAVRQQARWNWVVEPLSKDAMVQIQSRADDPLLPAWARIQAEDDSKEWMQLDPAYSRILVHQQAMIGWIICHRPTPGLLRYTTIWVDPPWNQRGAFFSLLVDVIRDAHFQGGYSLPSGMTAGAPLPEGCFGFHLANLSMAKLSMKQFRRVASSWVETRRRILYLQADNFYARGEVTAEL